MKLKNNKGFTGIDISISLIIMILFVSVIATLSYNFSLASRKVERKGEATSIIVQILEQLKQEDFETIHSNMTLDNIEIAAGYDVEITVQSYDEFLANEGITIPAKDQNQDIIKIATVLAEYKVGKSTEKVEISTIFVNNK